MPAPASLLRVALIGNPNSGKTTLFNRLTGLHQRTGNFPGVTVDKKAGIIRLENKRNAELVDLPGTYSLYPRSLDEKITAEYLLKNEQRPDAVLVIADASNLKRSLFLISQLQELNIPMVVVMNMIDMAIKNGDTINLEALQKEFGVPFIPCNSRTGLGMADVIHVLSGIKPGAEYRRDLFSEPSESIQQMESVERYQRINRILDACYKAGTNRMNAVTSRADKVLTHWFMGYLIFFAILFVIFQSLFYLSAWPMDLIDGWFAGLSDLVHRQMGHGEFASLLADGIIPGIGGVLMFVPQIAFLFLFITILEDTGYMARVSFIMDRLFRNFGMSGRSVIPLISGTACAIPAIMGTRTIGNWKERMITIFVTPMMSCSARLPVYAFMITLVIPERSFGGIFQLQGLVLMGLYLMGFLGALGTAGLLKWILRSRERSYFIMELPVYRYPRWTSVGITIVDKIKVFIRDAGLVIIAISIILWFLASHGPGEKFREIEQQVSQELKNGTLDSLSARSLESSEKLKASWAGIIGRAMEPAIAPLGFDWKIGISLVTSFAAREVFVGTMATIYAVGEDAESSGTLDKLRKERRADGSPVFTFATGMSLMIFYVFAMQCMSTFAVVLRETRSWKWPLIQTVYLSLVAWLGSFIVYTLLK